MIKIVTDTLAGLPVEYLKAHDIACLPQIVIFGEKSFRDDTEMDAALFLSMLKESPVMPKTSAPPSALYTPIFEKLLGEGHTVLVIAPSAILSGTYGRIMTAVNDFPGADIHVYDTRVLSAPMGAAVMEAVRLAEEGKSVPEITAHLDAFLQRNRVYFVVATLEFLHKNGRIGGAAALVGSILQVKPILTLKNSQVETFEKQRTQHKAIRRIVELTLQDCPKGPGTYLSVMHGDSLEEARALAAELGAALQNPHVPIYEVPAAILTHAGPGVLAVSFYTA